MPLKKETKLRNQTKTCGRLIFFLQQTQRGLSRSAVKIIL